jgi:hypothetical protein
MVKGLIKLWLTALMLSGCGAGLNEQSSELKIDQELRIYPQRAQRFKEFYQRVLPVIKSTMNERKSVRIAPSVILPFQFIASEARAVDQAFGEQLVVTCYKAKCIGRGRGTGISTTLINDKEVDLISFGQQISVKFRFAMTRSTEIIEICGVSGVKVKSGVLEAPLDGGYLRYKRGTKGQATSAVMDVGPLGSYPSSKCN